MFIYQLLKKSYTMSVSYSQSSSFQFNSSDFLEEKMGSLIKNEDLSIRQPKERYGRYPLSFHQVNGVTQQSCGYRNSRITKQVIYSFVIETIEQLFLCIILLQKFKRNLSIVKCDRKKLHNQKSVLLCFYENKDLNSSINQVNKTQMLKKLKQYFVFEQHSVPAQYLTIMNAQLALRSFLPSMLDYQDSVLINVQYVHYDIKANIQLILDFIQYDPFIIDQINQGILILQRSTLRNHHMNLRLQSESDNQKQFKEKQRNLQGWMKVNWKDGLCLDLQKLWSHLQKEHPGQEQELINENEEELSNLFYKKSIKTNCSIEIFQRAHVRFIISFDNKKQMKNFLKEIHETQLCHGLQHNDKTSFKKNAIQMNVKDLAQLSSIIQLFQAQHFKKPLISWKKYDKRQSQELILKNQSSEDDILKKVNEVLKRYDLLSMKSMWDGGLSDYIEGICKNWEVYNSSLSEELRIFTMVTIYKMHKVDSAKKHAQIYQHIYPKLNYFLNFFMEKLGILSIQSYLSKMNQTINPQKPSLPIEQQQQQIFLETIRKQLNIQQTLVDKIFYYFLKQEKSLNINVPLNTQNRNSMSSYIAECQEFYLNSRHWNQIFTSFMRQLHPKTQKSILLIDQIQKERLVENRCLGCSTFFVEQQNIYDEQVYQSPLKVFRSVSQLKDYQTQIKDWICAMMNSGGGIILFDCVKDYKEIYSMGTYLNHKDKEQIQQRLYSYSNQFYPKLQVKGHIYVTFVPIVEFAYEKNAVEQKYVGIDSILKENYSFKKRKEAKGKYVTRIKVTPIDPTLVYFWSAASKMFAQGQIRKYCQVINKNGTIKQLSNREMVKFIKEKMKSFYKNNNFNEEQKKILCFPSIFISHKCLEPELGTSIKQKIVNKSYYYSSLQDQYSYLSLLVARPQDHAIIRENLKRRNFNFRIPEENLFHNYSFKSAKNTAALYHNTKFQDILVQISNNRRYYFNNRQTLIINVTSYLKLEKRNQKNPLDQKTFKEIEMDFAKEYHDESLKLYEFKTQDRRRQYYLLTQTKTSNLFLYYLLNEKNREKTVFKNPFLLDKLSPQERKTRMVLICQRKGRNDILSQCNNKFLQPLSSSRFNQSYIFEVDNSSNDSFLPSIETLESQEDKQSALSPKEEKQATFWQNPSLSRKDQENKDKDYYLYATWEEVLSEYEYHSISIINLLK